MERKASLEICLHARLYFEDDFLAISHFATRACTPYYALLLIKSAREARMPASVKPLPKNCPSSDGLMALEAEVHIVPLPILLLTKTTSTAAYLQQRLGQQRF